jgi:hypothetical protein
MDRCSTTQPQAVHVYWISDRHRSARPISGTLTAYVTIWNSEPKVPLCASESAYVLRVLAVEQCGASDRHRQHRQLADQTIQAVRPQQPQHQRARPRDTLYNDHTHATRHQQPRSALNIATDSDGDEHQDDEQPTHQSTSRPSYGSRRPMSGPAISRPMFRPAASILDAINNNNNANNNAKQTSNTRCISPQQSTTTASSSTSDYTVALLPPAPPEGRSASEILAHLLRDE